MKKVLVFDVWADYAHFRKYYTTTSPLTFSIPPKTSIYGLISAIIGLDKSEYLDYFQSGKCKVGIQVKKPIKKTRINFNLINTKKAIMMSMIKNRTQIKTEFLKDVKYRFYIHHSNTEIYDRLKNYLEEHKCVYSISLGLSENLANYEYIGEYNVKEVINNQEWVEMVTALRLDENNLKKGDIDFEEEGKEYFSDKVAIEMKPDREVTDYGQLVFERNGQTIRAKPRKYYQLENGDRCYLF